jgi:hypothetical protein
VTSKGSFTKTIANFPKFDSFISRTGYNIVALEYEIDVRNVVIVAVEGSATLVVVIKIPQFNSKVG